MTCAESRSSKGSTSRSLSGADSDYCRKIRGQQLKINFLITRLRRAKSAKRLAKIKVFKLKAVQRQSERSRQADGDAWQEEMARSESPAKADIQRCKEQLQRAEDQQKLLTSERVEETGNRENGHLHFWQLQVQHLYSKFAGVEQLNQQAFLLRQHNHQLQEQIDALKFQLEGAGRLKEQNTAFMPKSTGERKRSPNRKRKLMEIGCLLAGVLVLAVKSARRFAETMRPAPGLLLGVQLRHYRLFLHTKDLS